jgi:hypothetical protein
MASIFRAPNPIEHVEVTIKMRDGSTSTYAAKEPLRFNLDFTFLDLLHFDVRDGVPPVEITAPPLSELSITFAVNPLHGITVDLQPAPEVHHGGA